MVQFKVAEWQSGSGNWYVADTTTFTKWWQIPRFLNISLDEYIKLLVNDYKVDDICYNKEKDVLLFSWENTTMSHKFMLFINRMARNGNWQVNK